MFPGLSGAKRAEEKLYVEDVFSAFTYTGNGSARSIVNGIDLSTKGGMTWLKIRDSTADHDIYDTVRGATKSIITDTTAAETTQVNGVTAFNSDGFSIGSLGRVNNSGSLIASWTFRKAAKFFDVVTYTGNGSTQAIAHSLGIAPGMVWIKCSNSAGTDWQVWHKGLTSGYHLVLNTTGAQTNANSINRFGDNSSAVDPTSTHFTIGSNSELNTNGATYVAYLFAHDTTSDGIIQCGGFTSDGSGNATVSLGWEPQYLLIKKPSTTGEWWIIDTARGWNISTTTDANLWANATNAEFVGSYGDPTATGFTLNGFSSSTTYIYMAIRKGLMRVPTDATKVFAINASTGTGAARTISGLSITTGPDLIIAKARNDATGTCFSDRLRGTASQLVSSSSSAQLTDTSALTSFNMDGVSLSAYVSSVYFNSNSANYINYFLKQARGFMDEVAYIGTGSAHTEPHNLGAVPELMIMKCTNTTRAWVVYYGDATKALELQSTASTGAAPGYWNDTAPTASVFTVGSSSDHNGSGNSHIAYLLASVSGVQKIGTFTSNGATDQINCGFAAGARFVMMKRVNSTSDWYVWDTTRGIVSGNDPYIVFNSSAAEVTSTDRIDPYSSGFETTGLWSNGDTILYWAIA